MIKEEYMEQGITYIDVVYECRDCKRNFIVEGDNKCTRESYRCKECNKNYSWFKIIYNMFF